MTNDELLLMQELAKREMARRSYAEYLPYVHPGWIDTRMSRYIAQRLQDFAMTDTGHAYDILVIETPPQHGKSMTVSESFPSWYLGRRPEDRVIELSYNDESAKRFLRRNREKVENHGANLFTHTLGQMNTINGFELDNGRGSLISRGIMGGITGNPANLILIDDPIKNREEADSETIRAKVWDEWVNSVKTRLAAGAKVIIIMTPWHEDDLAARVLATEPNSQLLRLPVEAEENDLLGRAVGEPLCPELGKDASWLKEFKESYIADPQGGQRAWQALFQCSPRTEGGNMIDRSWWKYYTTPPKDGRQVISVDATFKDAEDNDYVAITVWQQVENDFYLLYCRNAHLDFVSTVASLRSIRQLYPRAQGVLIEDKANGSAIINVLQKEMFCIPVNPKGGKVARVNAVAPAIESGHVYLPESAPWLADYVEQWCLFPAGSHDDMVDSSSQALNYLILGSGHIPKPLTEDETLEYEGQEFERKEFISDAIFDPYHTDEMDMINRELGGMIL